MIFDAFAALLICEKNVANYALLRCKTFSLKIWLCKISDKYHVWRGINKNLLPLLILWRQRLLQVDELWPTACFYSIFPGYNPLHFICTRTTRHFTYQKCEKLVVLLHWSTPSQNKCNAFKVPKVWRPFFQFPFLERQRQKCIQLTFGSQLNF